MAERSVIWKAIADFSAISRQARKARQELEELEKTSKRQGQSSAQSAREQAAANKGVADSQRDSSNASSIALGMLGRLSAARRAEAAAAQGAANSTNQAANATRNLAAAQNSSASATDNVTRRLSQANSSADQHAASMNRASASHQRFGASAGATSRLLMGLRNALSSLSGGSSSSTFDRIGNSLRGMDDNTRRSTSNMQLLQGVISGFRGNEFLSFLRQATLSRLPVRLQLMGNAAMVAGDAIGALSGALAGLSAGLVGMVGALSPAIGLLGALPGVALAATGAFGSLLGSLSGIGGALKAFDQQQTASARTSGTAARRTLDNNRRVAQSERNLAAQRRASANAIRDAERGIRDARERSAQVQVDTARQIANAEKSIVQAKERVVDAERGLVRAQRATNEARAEAVRRLQDLERQTKSYALSEEGAALSLEESRRRLIEVMNDPGSTDIERRAADLAVREAEARLEDIRFEAGRHQEELAEARQKGIEGSDQVVSALESEQDAHRAIAEAMEGVGEAEQNLADTRADAARSIRDANEAVERAEEALAEAHLRAAEQMENANAAMEGTAAAAIPAAAGVNKFAEAMAKLTPEAQAVVWQLLRMREGWEEIRKTAERAVLPGVLVFLQSVEKLFPTITTFVAAAGREVGAFAADLGRMISSGTAIDRWNVVLEDAVQIVANWRIGLLNVAQVLGDIAVAAADSGLNDWLWGIVVGWTEVWKAFTAGEEGQERLINFFRKAMERAELLGSIIGGLAGFFYNVGRAGDEAGMRIWRSFDNALKTFNDWAKSEEGFRRIKAVADESVPIFQELGLLVVDIAKGMGDLLVRGEGGSFIRLLRTEFLPVLLDIFKVLQDTKVLENFVLALSSIGRTLVDSGLLTSLGELFNAVVELAAEAFPLLAPVIKVVIDILAGLVKGLTFMIKEMKSGSALGIAFGLVFLKLAQIIGAITFVAAIAGIGRFIGRLNEMRTSASQAVAIFQNLAEKIKTAFTGARRSAGFTDEENMPRRAVEAPPLDTRRAEREANAGGRRVAKEYVDGVEGGVRSEERAVHRAGENVGEELVDGTEDELGISSPSRKGLRIGRNFGDAVADGARSEKRNARRAGDEIGDALGDGAEDTVRRRGATFRNVVGSVFAVAGTAAVAAGAGLASLGISSVQSFGQLDQVLRKTSQVFGESSRAIQAWAETASVSMGMTRQETLNIANGFGTLFQQMGYSKQRSAELSQEFTHLAAGIAAANPGVEVVDAFHALEAALQGDYTEISRLNPALNENAVLQKALEMTGKTATSALTEQEKQAAFLALAHGQAEQASKDLAAQQDTTAGAMKRAQSRWETFKEKLGEKLDTKLQPVADDLEKLLGNEQLIDDLATVLGGMASALAWLTRELDRYFKIRSGAQADPLGFTNVEEEATKVGADKEWRKRREQELGRNLTVEDLEAEARNRVVARGDDTTAYDAKKAREEQERRDKQNRKNERADTALSAMTGGAPNAVPIGESIPDGVQQGMENKGPGFWSFITGWFDKYVVQPVKKFLGIESPSTLFAGFGVETINGFFSGITSLASTAWNFIRTWFDTNIVRPVKNFLGIESPSTLFFAFALDVINGFFNGISSLASTAWNFIRTWFDTNIVQPVKNFFGIASPSTLFFGFALDVINGFFNGITSLASQAITFIRTWFDTNIAQPVKNFFGIQSPSTLFFGFALDVIQGFFNGVGSLAQTAITFIRTWFDTNIAKPIKDFFGINSPSTLTHGYGQDVIRGFMNGVESLRTQAETTVRNLVTRLGDEFKKIEEKFNGPTKFIVETVYNKGIVPMWNAVAGLVNLSKLNPITYSGGGQVQDPAARFDTGGWTGPGDKYKPAGIVHADEYVVRKTSRRKLESKNPGLLDHINRTGELPGKYVSTNVRRKGYKDGGHVGDEGPALSPNFTERVLFNSPEGLTPQGQISFMGGTHPLQSLFAALFMGGAAPVPGGNVTNFHGANGAYYGTRWAGDLAMPTGTPVYAWKAGTVAHTERLAGSYGLNIIVNHADGSSSRYAHLSAFAVSPNQQVAQGQRIGSVGSTGNSTGPHLHFEIMGGNAPLNLSASGSATAAPAITAFDRMKELITDPIESMKAKFGDNQVTEALMKIPTTMADKAKAFLDEKLASIVDAIPFVPGGSGTVPGLSGVTANTYAKAANIYAAATGAGHRISTVGGWRADWEHSSRMALDFMVNNKAAGDYISAYVLGNKDRFGLTHVIWWQRINSGTGWRGMSDRGSPTQNHMDHPHVFFYPADKAIGGFDGGGWTGAGPRMKPAGVVHADEFVIKKPSRRSFEKKHPGVLDYINQTGHLPAAPGYIGYHEGGIVKTGGTGEAGAGGAWWRKGTSFGTNKWLGALRHFLGLDNWWAGWDDDLDQAIRNYDGRPATHVYGPWQGIMAAMRRLPIQEFTSAQNVANKIGANVDTIFRMMDTNRTHFNRDLGDRAKNDAMERSYADFRNFHRESVEELQSVMGVEVTGYWTEEMRRLLSHLKHHVAGTAHPNDLPTAAGWSTVGTWGEAFNEIYRTIKINEEWDKMMDQFFVWGYDSLMRFLGEKGTASGMELARDLYNNQMNARDADVYYRHYYEREDAIKDEQSELNRLRRLVNLLRRHDNMGLQGLASELELTMDTTAMLYKKAQDKDMLNGVSLSKRHRLDKDVIEFDDLFRFAMGGMVPGRGNLDSVLALLTPGEYVLTKEETKRLINAQDMIAKYRNPTVSTDIPGMLASAGAVTNIVNNNTTNNVNATIVSPNPELAGVAFQKHMKRLRDNGMFGVNDGDG